MDSKASRPAIEIAAEWTAACCVGAAVAIAALKVAILGPVAATVIALACGAAALSLLGLVSADGATRSADFAPIDFPGDVLLLDEPVEPVLLLDTPLTSAAESRVIRLFGDAPQSREDAEAIPLPGEMLARIEDFLGVDRGSAQAAEPAALANRASAEASAALHAALADIRRSLRQA